MSDALVHTVREFCRREVRAAAIDAAHTIPPRVLSGLAELGLFGLTLPEAWGGSAARLVDATKVIAALAEADRSVATTVGLHLGLGTRGLVAFGSAAQHQRWGPALASGACIAAFATTEPNAGSDLSALQSVARAQGDGFVLDGAKAYVTNGAVCGLLTVTASTPGLGGAARGTSLFLVEPTAAGVTRHPEERKLGLRGSSTTGFTFDGCALPREALVGEPGHGPRMLAHVLSWGRLLLSAGCVGTARAAMKLALGHVRVRKQFGRTLLEHEVVARQLARAWALLSAMQALVVAAAEAEDDHAELARLTTSTKVFCSEAAGQIIDLALQLHGGSGYVEDTGLALLARDARVTRIFEGANDVLLTHAGLLELTHPTPGAGPLFDAIAQRRAAMGGVRALRQHAEQHHLGRAVMWRDAVTAVRAHATSDAERGAADWLHTEALAHAGAPVPPSLPALTTALQEGLLP